MKGRRNDDWFRNTEQNDLLPGDYMKDTQGQWYIVNPCAKPPLYPASIAKHTVEEHEDGTITVSPSILIRGAGGDYHGYLRGGEWTEDMG